MSVYTDIVGDIAAKLLAVPGTGVIHTYERQAVDLKKFIDLFLWTVPPVDPDADPPAPVKKEVRGWEITRRAVPEHRRGAVFRHHEMVLKGYLGLRDADATSVELQETVDAICAAFRTADPPAGAAWGYYNGDDAEASPCQVERIDDRMFGGVLCHCAEIALSVTERIV